MTSFNLGHKKINKMINAGTDCGTSSHAHLYLVPNNENEEIVAMTLIKMGVKKIAACSVPGWTVVCSVWPVSTKRDGKKLEKLKLNFFPTSFLFSSQRIKVSECLMRTFFKMSVQSKWKSCQCSLAKKKKFLPFSPFSGTYSKVFLKD